MTKLCLKFPARAENQICCKAREEGECAGDAEAESEREFVEASEAVAQEVDHVDNRIEGGKFGESFWEGANRVEDAAEESQWCEDEILDEGEFVEVAGPDTDDYSHERKEEGN